MVLIANAATTAEATERIRTSESPLPPCWRGRLARGPRGFHRLARRDTELASRLSVHWRLLAARLTLVNVARSRFAPLSGSPSCCRIVYGPALGAVFHAKPIHGTVVLSASKKHPNDLSWCGRRQRLIFLYRIGEDDAGLLIAVLQTVGDLGGNLKTIARLDGKIGLSLD
jgi:hypothetical protein